MTGELTIEGAGLVNWQDGDLAIRGDFSSPRIELQVRDSSDAVVVYDTANDRPLLQVNVDGTVAIPGDRLTVDGAAMARRMAGVRVVGDGTGSFRTIQAAHDDVDGDWETARKILVTQDYDPSAESFPVEIRKRVHLVSSPGMEIHNPSANDTFVVDLGGSETDVFNRPPGVVFEGVAVTGGNHGFRNEDSRWSAWFNCHAEDVGGDGWHFIDKPPEYAVNTHALLRCTADSPEATMDRGVYVGGSVNTVQLLKCAIRNCTAEGIHVAANASFSMMGGGVQYCGEYGIEFDNSRTASVRGVYFEYNSRSHETPEAEIVVRNSADGIYIRDCHFHGQDTVRRAVRAFSGDTGVLENCTFGGYTTDFVHVDATTDWDLRRTSHRNLDDVPFGGGSGTRTRSAGVIGAHQGGVDVSEESGAFVGDRALDDGTNTPSGHPGLAIWVDTTGDGSGDSWHIAGTSATV